MTGGRGHGHPGEQGRIAAGDLTARMDDTGLRHVRLGEHEILRRVFSPVRDPSWRTLAGRARRRLLAPDRAVWEIDHEPVPLRTRLDARLSPDRLTLDFTAEASGDVEVNRAGLCLLHPLTQVGATCRASLDGAPTTTITRLPDLIEPQPLLDGRPAPMLGPFDHLTIADPQVSLEFLFDGELFEMEDQRNWLDASFKTYCTPLSESRPRTLRGGSSTHQRVEMRITTRADTSTVVRSAPRRVAVSGPTRIEAVLSHPIPEEVDLRFAVRSGVDAFRVEARVADGGDQEPTRRLARAARAAGAEITLVVLLPSGPDGGPDREHLAALSALLPDINPEVLLMHDVRSRSGDESECTTPELIRAVTAHLSRHGMSVPVGGGSPFNLCEFQRHDLTHLPIGAFSLTPTVHADDPESVTETVESLADVVATASARMRGRPLALGPLQGTARLITDLGRPPAPPDATWVRDAVRLLRSLGVARLCTLDVSDLVRGGALTQHGHAALSRESAMGDHIRHSAASPLPPQAPIPLTRDPRNRR